MDGYGGVLIKNLLMVYKVQNNFRLDASLVWEAIRIYFCFISIIRGFDLIKELGAGEIKYKKILCMIFPFGVAFHTYGVLTQNWTG